MNKRIRTGFTLIELLVVIAIVGVLFGLILSAVQKVRGAADRLSCLNNMKQIGLALQVHHGQFGRFPMGRTSTEVGVPLRGISWMGRLLPFIEQEALWKKTLEAFENRPAVPYHLPHFGISTPLKLFGCPGDSRVNSVQKPRNRGVSVALTSYHGVSGRNHKTKDGVLFYDSQIRMVDIGDGASNTLMVGERPPSTDMWYGWWYSGEGQDGFGSMDYLLGVNELHGPKASFCESCPSGPFQFERGKLSNQCSAFHFWSVHSDGAHFLFADGSAKFLNYSAAPIMQSLASRGGGEPVEVP